MAIASCSGLLVERRRCSPTATRRAPHRALTHNENERVPEDPLAVVFDSSETIKRRHGDLVRDGGAERDHDQQEQELLHGVSLSA